MKRVIVTALFLGAVAPFAQTSRAAASQTVFSLAESVTPSNPAPTMAAIVTLASDSGAGMMRPVLNGGDLPDVMFAPQGKRLVFLESARLVEKDNVLELRSVSGGGLKVDTVATDANGWNVGYDNDTCTGDGFGPATANTFALGSGWSQFPRCITGPGNGGTPLNFRANLADDLIGKCRYTIEFKMRHAGVGATVTDAVAVVTDGGVTVLEEFSPGSSWQTVKVTVPANLLKAGVNDFRIYRKDGVNRGSDDSDQIDYLRFHPLPLPAGFAAIVH